MQWFRDAVYILHRWNHWVWALIVVLLVAPQFFGLAYIRNFYPETVVLAQCTVFVIKANADGLGGLIHIAPGVQTMMEFVYWNADVSWSLEWTIVFQVFSESVVDYGDFDFCGHDVVGSFGVESAGFLDATLPLFCEMSRVASPLVMPLRMGSSASEASRFASSLLACGHG